MARHFDRHVTSLKVIQGRMCIFLDEILTRGLTYYDRHHFPRFCAARGSGRAVE